MKPKSHRTCWRPVAFAAAGCLLLLPTRALAGGAAYWAGFKKYWLEVLGNPEGVVVVVLLVGVVSLFIITRGKWNK
jgi:hypothetical protein